MKLYKLAKKLFLLPPLLLPLTPTSIFLTSCSSNKNKYFDYIHARSFSLITQFHFADYPEKGDITVWGTCWILAKVDDDVNSYHYYVGTNLQVSYAFFSGYAPYNYSEDPDNPDFIATKIEYDWYKIGDYKNGKFNIGSEHYISINKEKIKPVYDYLTFANDDDDEETKKDQSIDFNVIDVDFSNINWDSYVDGAKFKIKLDKLNNFYHKYGYINKFADLEPKRSVSGYCAGFSQVFNPSTSYYGTKWASAYFPNLTLCLPEDNCPGEHLIISPEQNVDKLSYWDASPNYLSEDEYNFDRFSLVEGSTGSMLINSNFEILGIYWGGTGTIYGYQPMFSIFHSNIKDFVKDYIN